MSPEVSAETLRACIDRQGDAPALVVAEDSGTTAYRELGARVDELAGQLSAVGVARGATVALVLPNGPEFVEVLLAISTLGAIAAPLNPAYTRDEHRFYLDDLRPAVLVLAVGETPAAREACSAATRIVEAVIDQKAGLGLSADGEPVEAVTGYDIAAPDDIALLLHTSGTTSRPKQVPLTHRNLLASARTIAAFYELTPSDVSFCVMPLFHVHGLVASTLAPLVSGGTVVVARRLAPRRFWGQLEQRGVTWLSAGPTLHHMLVERADPDRARLVRFARSCSSALSAELFARCEEAYGAPMLEAYGMTEASHQMASNPLPPGERRVGSVGVATGIEIAIADDAGTLLDAGAVGEVCIRGPGVTTGYLGNPEANESSFFDGWFRTGDQGVLDRAGYLTLTGRIKELILRGGENISPLEVEEVLLAHPLVEDAVAFGIADDKYGEEVGAAVATSHDVSAQEIVDHCRERLSSFKVPKAVHVLEEIPRTATGKVQRRRVAELLHGTG